MPILEIEIVAEPKEQRLLASELADAAGAILSPARRGATWVRLRWLRKTEYAESGWSYEQTPCPVFVHVLVASWPEEAERAAISEQLCEALAPLCERAPSLVHILWEPPAGGRIAFGGRLVPSDALSSASIETS